MRPAGDHDLARCGQEQVGAAGDATRIVSVVEGVECLERHNVIGGEECFQLVAEATNPVHDDLSRRVRQRWVEAEPGHTGTDHFVTGGGHHRGNI